MLLLVHDDKVLLEQRPQEGIWGGLLSLPEFNDTEALTHYLQNHGLTINPEKDLIKMAAFEHIFSHFKLHIQPILMKLTNHQQLQEKHSGQSYYSLQNWQSLPIPKPVNTILDTLTSAKI